MEITIWGARGSIPTPAAGTTRYGGNTTCIEARTSAGDILIFDAGTGIRALGETLVQSDIRHCSLFISHAHWDHLQGLPFFGPIFDPEDRGDDYWGYTNTADENSTSDVMALQLRTSISF